MIAQVTELLDTLKQCNKCRAWLPFSEFPKHHAIKCGRSGVCRTCKSRRSLMPPKCQAPPEVLAALDALQSSRKRCRKCEQWKPFSEFGVDRNTNDGLVARCKDCIKQDRVQRVPTPPAKRCSRCNVLKPQEHFHHAAENHDGLRADCKPCRRKAARDGARKRRAANPECFRSREKQYRKANSETMRAIERRKYERRISTPIVHQLLKDKQKRTYERLPAPNGLTRQENREMRKRKRENRECINQLKREVREALQADRAANPQKYRDLQRLYLKHWQSKNQDRIKKWRDANKDRVRKKAKADRVANPEKHREQRRRAYDKIMADPAKRKKYNLKQQMRGHGYRKHKPDLYTEQGMCCNLCGDLFDFFDLQIDHKVPVSRADEYPGYIHEKANLHLLCPPCNCWKRDRTWDEVLADNESLEQWLSDRRRSAMQTIT